MLNNLNLIDLEDKVGDALISLTKVTKVETDRPMEGVAKITAYKVGPDLVRIDIKLEKK